SDSPAPQTRQPRGDGESAGSILASFGLSNDDLEVLSHYPDDQLTPDTLPFILRDIQLKKSGKQKSVSSTSSSSYSHNVTPTGSSQSHSAEVPSLLTVTQTAGKVIDYGHASRGTEESGTRETFKREQLSSERTDRDYRQVESKQRLPSETRSEDSSRRSPSSSSASRHGSSKKLPTPTMISDFAAVSPKVFPHTCSLCHIQCDQEKDWVDHINTVDHTAACRDLRNKYPDWKPNLPSGKYRREPFMHRPHGRPYSPPRHPRPHYHTGSPHAAKNLPVKKKKKVAGPASQGAPFADRLVYLTGIPIDATEQEVTDLVSSFGKINNVILLPCSEEASVCMMKTEDAQALASASELCIREQPITALVAKFTNRLLSAGGETDQKTSDQYNFFKTCRQKWNVLVTGLPDSGWSDADVAELVQSVGAPSDIILAKHVGKALVSFPDLEVAEELVKVHSFKPAMFKDTEVKMTLVKKQIGLSTPDKPPEDTQAAAEPSEQDAESQPDHCEDPHLAEMEGKDDCVEEEEEDLGVSVSSPASDAKPDEDAGDAENTEVHEDAGESEVENVEETQAPSSYAGSVSPEMPMPELPKEEPEEPEEDEFPFNMSDFVTVDELGDVTELPDAAVSMETSDEGETAPPTEQEEEHMVEEEHEAKNEEHKEQNEEKSEAPNEESNKPQQSQDEENMNEAPGKENKHKQVQRPEKTKKAEDTREESVKKPLPPYDPSAAVGLEYLVPKTGFFCKVCSRFFTGAKAAEISHCKTLKHYENLQVWFIEEQNIYTTKEIM
uniref:Zinc finger protein 638-like n=1 Tax=Poecilia formosa TaxID=48698 RepID=A0A096M884_POEFO